MFIAEIFVKIIFVVAVGFVLKHFGVISSSMQKNLSGLLVTGIVPFNILEVSNCIYSTALAKNVGISAIICLAYYITAIFLANLLSRRLNISLSSKHVFITMIVFANVGFIGFSLTGEIFGEEGTLYCVVYNLFYNVLIYTYGINLLSNGNKLDIKAIFTKPVTIACIAAIIIFFTPISIPKLLMPAIKSVGDMVFPVSMIIIGCEINDINISELFKTKSAYIVTSLRLLILPLAMAAILHALGLKGVLPRTMVVLTALPCGSMNIIFAEHYNCSPKYAAITVVQSMLALILTLPVIIAVTFAFL